MTLNEWDKRIAPKLQDLEYCSNTIARMGRHIQALAQTLPMRPAWETKAREALNEAENEMRIGLAIIKAAQRIYDNAPVITEAAE